MNSNTMSVQITRSTSLRFLQLFSLSFSTRTVNVKSAQPELGSNDAFDLSTKFQTSLTRYHDLRFTNEFATVGKSYCLILKRVGARCVRS